MRLIVEESDPREPGPRALLAASHALMESLFPPDENHLLPVEALAEPGVHFFTARLGADIVGTIALTEKPGYGEVKSLYVSEAARGSGAADALLRAVEDRAMSLDLPLLRLETGDALVAAIAFYRRHGFAEREPFGDYRVNTTSIYMEKALGRTRPRPLGD